MPDLDMEIGRVAIGVLATLLVMSVLSIAITVDRAWAFRKAMRGSRRCAGDVQPLIHKRDGAGARGVASRWHERRAPRGTVVTAGLVEWTAWGPEDEDRAVGAAREAAAFAAEMSLD